MHERVELRIGNLPKDYHCSCVFCKKFLGELIRPDGTHYSRNDRRHYYTTAESASTKDATVGHIAKTPLHIARWAVQTFTKGGDWVLDPTAGAGTTLVEALTHGRNAVGVEIQTIDVMKNNIKYVLANPETDRPNAHHACVHGDARELKKLLDNVAPPKPFALIVNNPPYSGDASQVGFKGASYTYDETRANLAFLKEGPEYFMILGEIYTECCRRLRKGGRLVIGVKDQTHNKAPDMLHHKIAEVIMKIPDMKYEGTAVLRHYPTTLHLNTYFKKTGVHPPYFQTICVFQKK